ncbi:MAG: ATP-binding protein [Desulfohalobiaceae bacterium]
MFRKAEKRQAKLRMALIGPSGSGKTYSSLLVAKGLGGPIAMIDTEQGSGELYADLADYDVARLTPPFTPQRYIQAIQEAEKAGYNVLIIDSLSHAWAGQGGLLEEVDKRKAAQKNQFTAWRDVTPMHNALVEAMLQSSCHIIATMRSKTAYDFQKDDKGQLKPVKIGLAPVQRDGMEYEFTVVMDLENEKHMASSTKDRTSLFDGQYFVPSQETGQTLRQWLESGSAPAQEPEPAAPPQFEAPGPAPSQPQAKAQQPETQAGKQRQPRRARPRPR